MNAHTVIYASAREPVEPVKPVKPVKPGFIMPPSDPSASSAISSISFNLVDEPWIPCIQAVRAASDSHASQPLLLSLREVFHQGPALLPLADASPIVTISLYRLLLAILHRSLGGPRTTQEWLAIFTHGAWDTARIDAYLTRWHDRFDLFDPHYPFYQTPGLPVTERTGAATVLAHERASSRNQPLLFDHTIPDRARLSPAAAARALLAQQNFAVGGLISYDSRKEPLANKYVSMAPLLGTAICLVRGVSLFETLLLNLVRYSPADEAPFPAASAHSTPSAPFTVSATERVEDSKEVEDVEDVEAMDRPAWERTEPTEPVARTPDGYVDLLTWQSRRIRLVPDVFVGSGEVVVERAVLMKGYQLDADFARHQAETMLAFRASARGSTKTAARRASAQQAQQAAGAAGAAGAADDPGRAGTAGTAEGTATPEGASEGAAAWTPLTFQPDRLIWRDSRLLFQSERGARMRPAILDWLCSLALQGAFDDQRTLSLDLMGMVPDQATIEEWRRETLSLPLPALYDDATAETIVQLVALAESVARLLAPGAVTFPLAPATGDARSVTAGDTPGEAGRGRVGDVKVGKPVMYGSPLSMLAEELLAGSPARTVERGARDQLVARFGASLRYWSQLDVPFRRTLQTLQQTRTRAVTDWTNEGGANNEAARVEVMRIWAMQVERVARQVFQQVVGQLGTSPRAVRAVALAQSRLNVCLAALLAPFQSQQGQQGHQQIAWAGESGVSGVSPTTSMRRRAAAALETFGDQGASGEASPRSYQK